MPSAEVIVSLPAHLRRLTGLGQSTVTLEVETAGDGVTLGAVLDVLERAYPMLRGTVRDHPSQGAPGALRPFIRIFACEQDLTPAGLSAALPPEVVAGQEVLRIIGAIAGGSGATGRSARDPYPTYRRIARHREEL